MAKNNTYWNGLEQYNADTDFQGSQKNEFQEDLPIEGSFSEESLGVKSNRRDFLKIFGFGLTAATLSACVDKPVRKAIPYLVKPENVTPGTASWYASTCSGCAAACGILLKSREGRPIKVEGNENHPMNKGGVCPVGQATVLDLYDAGRLRAPRGPEVNTWAAAEKMIATSLSGGGEVVIVSKTIHSPTSKKVIDTFLKRFRGKHVTYDPVSNYALAKVHSDSETKLVVPSFDFFKRQKSFSASIVTF